MMIDTHPVEKISPSTAAMAAVITMGSPTQEKVLENVIESFSFLLKIYYFRTVMLFRLVISSTQRLSMSFVRNSIQKFPH